MSQHAIETRAPLQGAAPLMHGSLQRTCRKCGEKDEEKKSRVIQRTTVSSGPEHLPPIVEEELEGQGSVAQSGRDFTLIPVSGSAGILLQGRLSVAAPGDRYELEADRVAEAVLRDSASPLHQIPVPHTACGASCPMVKDADVIHRVPVSPLIPQPDNLPDKFLSLLGPGQQLDRATREFFEPRLGTDLGDVRVFTDARAAESARDVNALAYTAGRKVIFGAGQYTPDSIDGKRLLAHELVHVVQQGGGAQGRMPHNRDRHSGPRQVQGHSITPTSMVIQRAGDPAKIPPGLRCPTDLTAGRPAGTDLLFPVSGSTITPAHTALLTTFRAAWLAAGGTDDIIVHGYASTDGDQGQNWTLSCDRAEAAREELVRLGIPRVRITVLSHGESTDFGAGLSSNRRAVVTSQAGFLPLPVVTGVLTAADNFAGRSTTRFGVGEGIALSFLSLPARPAADFGGLRWHIAAGGGVFTLVTDAGTATYTAPATAGGVRLELRVATGATAGRVISTHPITIVVPNGVRMTAVPGSAPSHKIGGTIPAGTFGAGFRADVFVDPKDVSFNGVVFGEGTVAGVVTPAGSFFSSLAGRIHPVNTFGPGHAGNATTGTPVSPPRDNISLSGIPPTGSLLGVPTCGASDVNFAIPWEFSVAGGPRTAFATANSHRTSTFLCNCTTEKGGAGPFCRRINGTAC
jgi:outer membrane protein OmpA-like peptidoglycan-associated protein